MVDNKKIKFTEMAMYVDNNVYEQGCDKELILAYLIKLAGMLAHKAKIFTDSTMYQDFAHFLAYIVYERMFNRRQFPHTKYDKNGVTIKNEDGSPKLFEPELPKVKSCLNYLKNVLYAKRASYLVKIDKGSLSLEQKETVISHTYGRMSSPFSDDTRDTEIDIYIRSIGRSVKKEIYSGVYKNDKYLAWCLYTSTILSLLRSFTLSNKNKEKLGDVKRKLMSSGVYKVDYEDTLSVILKEEVASAPIAYGIGDEYLDYISYIMQRVKKSVIKDIRYLYDSHIKLDDLYENALVGNGAFKGEANEE